MRAPQPWQTGKKLFEFCTLTRRGSTASVLPGYWCLVNNQWLCRKHVGDIDIGNEMANLSTITSVLNHITNHIKILYQLT